MATKPVLPHNLGIVRSPDERYRNSAQDFDDDRTPYRRRRTDRKPERLKNAALLVYAISLSGAVISAVLIAWLG